MNSQEINRLMQYLDSETAKDLPLPDDAEIEALAELQSMERLLKNHQRVEISPTKLNAYHQDLASALGKIQKSKWELMWDKLNPIFDAILWQPKPTVRFLQIAFLVLIGFYIGNLKHPSPMKALPVPATQNAPWLTKISQKDHLLLNQYMLSADLLLLQIKNLDNTHETPSSEIEFTQSIATELLSKNSLLQEHAMEQNNGELLRFLSRMDILLYELANLDETDAGASLTLIRQIVIDMQLDENVKMVLDMLEAHQKPSAI